MWIVSLIYCTGPNSIQTITLFANVTTVISRRCTNAKAPLHSKNRKRINTPNQWYSPWTTLNKVLVWKRNIPQRSIYILICFEWIEIFEMSADYYIFISKYCSFEYSMHFNFGVVWSQVKLSLKMVFKYSHIFVSWQSYYGPVITWRTDHGNRFIKTCEIHRINTW